MLSVRPVSNFLATKAAEELNEIPERLENDLQIFRNWLIKQSHIVSRPDDQFLILFLRKCKNSIQQAKVKIENFYFLRSVYPDIFSSRSINDPIFLEFLSQGITFPLNPTQADGSRIMFCKLGLYDPRKYDLTDYIKASFMAFDRYMLEDDNLTICGCTIFIDCKEFSLNHLSQLTPVLLNKLILLIRDAYPIRHKGLHVINILPSLEIFIKPILRMIPEKLAKLIYFHFNMNSLYEHIPKNVLPIEYGGEGGSLQIMQENYTKFILSCDEWYVNDAMYKFDKSKQIGELKDADKLYGIDGCFKKIEID